MFDENSSSYKFYWFWAILTVLKEYSGENAKSPLRVRTVDLLIEMIAAAYPTVTFFRLTLGSADWLERVCRSLESYCNVASKLNRDSIRVAVSENSEALGMARKMSIYVPALFLSPWFENEMRGISAGTDRARRAKELSILFRDTKDAPPYWLEGSGEEQMICFAPEWTQYLCGNLGVLESFLKHALCRFLHTKNPGVPAITEKLEMPRARKMGRAKTLWRKIMETPSELRRGLELEDIYRKEAITDKYSTDHFLPWSFVAHDQIWNLSPVIPNTNSVKGDAFPSIERYLPALAKLHWHIIQSFATHPFEQNEYASAFRVEFKALQREEFAALLGRYRDLVAPQLQIARNYGFQCDWTL